MIWIGFVIEEKIKGSENVAFSRVISSKENIAIVAIGYLLFIDGAEIRYFNFFNELHRLLLHAGRLMVSGPAVPAGYTYTQTLTHA